LPSSPSGPCASCCPVGAGSVRGQSAVNTHGGIEPADVAGPGECYSSEYEFDGQKVKHCNFMMSSSDE
jgi:hypothetical protein